VTVTSTPGSWTFQNVPGLTMRSVLGLFSFPSQSTTYTANLPPDLSQPRYLLVTCDTSLAASIGNVLVKIQNNAQPDGVLFESARTSYDSRKTAPGTSMRTIRFKVYAPDGHELTDAFDSQTWSCTLALTTEY